MLLLYVHSTANSLSLVMWHFATKWYNNDCDPILQKFQQNATVLFTRRIRHSPCPLLPMHSPSVSQAFHYMSAWLREWITVYCTLISKCQTVRAAAILPTAACLFPVFSSLAEWKYSVLWTLRARCAILLTHHTAPSTLIRNKPSRAVCVPGSVSILTCG